MRIVLLMANQMMRDGLRALLRREPARKVVGEGGEGPETLELVQELQPDLVIADVGSWASGNLLTIREITEHHPGIKVIALSTFSNRAMIVEAFRCGVQGYVLNQDGFDKLTQAINTVTAGGTYLCSQATQDILEICTTATNSGRSPQPALTDRECVILQMLAEGQTSKEVALSLDVSSKTVDACRRQIMHKLGVDSVAGLVKQALVLGLTTLSV